MVERSLVSNDMRQDICTLFPNDLELWLSFWLNDHPWLTRAEKLRNEAAGLHALHVIQNRLFAAEYTMAQAAGPQWLAKLVNSWLRDHPCVITLNYDTLVERCVAEHGIGCESLYPVPMVSLRPSSVAPARNRHPAFALHKLHGSASWFCSDAESASGGTLHYLPFRGWKDQVEGSKKLVEKKTPFIVPPCFNKATYLRHETLSRLWLLAGKALALAKRVFVLGYSLPPTDVEMRWFLATNARRCDQEIFVFDTKPEVVGRFSEVFFGKDRIRLNAYGDGEHGPIPPLADALHAEDELR